MWIKRDSFITFIHFGLRLKLQGQNHFPQALSAKTVIPLAPPAPLLSGLNSCSLYIITPTPSFVCPFTIILTPTCYKFPLDVPLRLPNCCFAFWLAFVYCSSKFSLPRYNKMDLDSACQYVRKSGWRLRRGSWLVIGLSFKSCHFGDTFRHRLLQLAASTAVPERFVLLIRNWARPPKLHSYWLALSCFPLKTSKHPKRIQLIRKTAQDIKTCFL